jgi:hypothetical protein
MYNKIQYYKENMIQILIKTVMLICLTASEAQDILVNLQERIPTRIILDHKATHLIKEVKYPQN